jgi:hypothetical protein
MDLGYSGRVTAGSKRAIKSGVCRAPCTEGREIDLGAHAYKPMLGATGARAAGATARPARSSGAGSAAAGWTRSPGRRGRAPAVSPRWSASPGGCSDAAAHHTCQHGALCPSPLARARRCRAGTSTPGSETPRPVLPAGPCPGRMRSACAGSDTMAPLRDVSHASARVADLRRHARRLDDHGQVVVLVRDEHRGARAGGGGRRRMRGPLNARLQLQALPAARHPVRAPRAACLADRPWAPRGGWVGRARPYWPITCMADDLMVSRAPRMGSGSFLLPHSEEGRCMWAAPGNAALHTVDQQLAAPHCALGSGRAAAGRWEQGRHRCRQRLWRRAVRHRRDGHHRVAGPQAALHGPAWRRRAGDL